MLKKYVEKFNANDVETVVQLVSNEKAYEFLKENAPTLECPDLVIEETFAFRTWTIRKHLKSTDDGVMMTEFLKDVPWAGKHNTINAPFFHHLNEYRWFKNANILLDYLWFFIENKGKALSKEYLFNQIWGSDSFSEQQTLTVHIKWLRQKIEEDPKNPEKILTVWGVGYKYESI